VLRSGKRRRALTLGKRSDFVPIVPFKGVWPRIAEDAYIAPTATVTGDVWIASEVSIWFGAVIRGDIAPVRIGPHSNVQDNCTIHADEGSPCEIGADCSIGHNAVIHGATLGDGVLVGMHATVLTGATLGNGCIVAASALVPEGKQVEADQLIMGIPAKVARPVTEEERARTLRGVQHYLAYAREYRAARQITGD
jgi:carbonic anhydrase/acetyltransferase-like protein (isoleucine patch superfamily)